MRISRTSLVLRRQHFYYNQVFTDELYCKHQMTKIPEMTSWSLVPVSFYACIHAAPKNDRTNDVCYGGKLQQGTKPR